MSSLESTQARFFLEQIALPWFKNEHPLTKRVIEAVPLDKGDYRPDPISKTALELAWHIASAENRFLETAINGQFSSSGSNRPESVRNSAEVAAWYAQHFEMNFDSLTKLTSEQLLK